MDNKTKIHYLRAISKRGNITKAAEEAFVSQPYLSRIVKSLEEELGTALFERAKNLYTLTFAGERYLHYLENLVSLEDEMETEMAMISKNKRGRITIGVNPALGSAVLPDVVPDFYVSHPGIQIKLVERNAADIERLLEENYLDVALGMTPVLNQNISYDLLYEESIFLLVPSQSRLYRESETPISEFPFDLQILDTEPLITLPPAFGMGRAVDEFYELNRLRKNTILTTDTIYTAIGFAAKGMGSTFITATSLRLISNLKRMLSHCCIYSFKRSVLQNKLVLMYKKNRSLSPAVLSFFDLAKRNFGRRGQNFDIVDFISSAE